MSDEDDEKKSLTSDEDEECPHPKRTHSKGNLKIKIKFLVIGLAVGVIAGALGLRFIQSHNPPDEPSTLSASTVFSRIVAQNEMISVSQDYNIVDKVSKSSRLLDIIDLPIFPVSFWYRYTGTIDAGVDMSQADFDQQGDTITVTLPSPYIISNTPDMDKSGILEENDTIFDHAKIKDADAFQEQCIEDSEEEAIAGGLLDEAKTNAEANIRNMFTAAFGDEYTIVFVWTE